MNYCPAMFPPEIVTTSRRPGITIYFPSKKQGVIIEITVPAEENLARYEFDPGKTSAGWELIYFAVVVGGFTNNTFRTCYKSFGLKKQRNKKGTGLCCKNSPHSYLYFVACKKHQAIWKLGVGDRPYISPTNPIED